ncbi:TlpA family protein disulfide reductase [Flavobacterium sp. UBA4197]|uniref:TlpA family protein disulfide reductase n=1 Tax=Flavobacterium sp. UBA4197 TaxID=1946546 RepID=UPI00257C5A5B|nr:thioredoxin family protein [Flavobacterium sp. UBA4197]
MKKFYVTNIALLLLSSTVPAQDNGTILFSYTLHKNIRQYSKKSDLAYTKGDIDRGTFLFDSLVKNQLTGTTFDNFSFKRLKKSRLYLNSIKKPVFLITYASWCVPSKGEIPALNKLAQRYGKDIQFIVLYWDRKNNIKKIAKKFNSRIEVCYAHETYNKDAYLVSTLKHTLGFPTSYFLDENLKVVNIKRGGAILTEKATFTKALDLNYRTFQEGLSCLLINVDSHSQRLAKH